MEERYKPSSSFITYAEGEYEPRRLDAGLAVVTYEPGGLVADAIAPSSEDPTIWKVKCAVWFSHIWSLYNCQNKNIGWIAILTFGT